MKKRNDLIDVKDESWYSESWNRRQAKNKTKKKRKAKQSIWECWRKVIWRKKKKRERSERRKWDYIDEKKNDWDAERKVSDWDAKSYETARGDRKNVVPVRGNWLRTAGLYDGGRGHMISITSVMKGLMMNLIIWLMIVSDLIVDDIRRWYDYLDDAVDAIICCSKQRCMYFI